MIKNAITYSVVIPHTSVDMLGFIESSNMISRKPGTMEIRTLGFTNHPVSGQLVTPFPSGYCIVIREWQKNIKSSIVRQMVQDKVKGRIISKKEMAEIKEGVVDDLIAITPPECRDYYVYYNTNDNKLIVNASNQSVGDKCTALLRKAIGSLKATTLYVDQSNGITQRMIDHLENKHIDSAFVGDLFLDEDSKLVLKGHRQQSLTYNGLDLYADSAISEIIELVDGSNQMYVSSMELSSDSIEFTLTDGFKLKSIKYVDFSTDYIKDDVVEWEGVVEYCVNQICNVTNMLLKEFTVVQEGSIG